MKIYIFYFLLIINCFILVGCSGDAGTSASPGSQGVLAPLKVSRPAVRATASTTQTNELIRLMQAAFNAAPGAINLEYLTSFLDKGMSMTELSELLTQTDAFKSPLLYPSSLSSQQFAGKFIDNLVGTTANYLDKALLADVIAGYLENGYSRGSIIWAAASLFTTIPTSDPHWGRVAAQLANKAEVAYYYSVTMAQSANDLGTLQAVVASVTDDPATVTAAKAQKPVNLAPSWAWLGISGGSRQITVTWTKTATKAAASTTGTYNLYWSKNPGVSKKTGKKIANVTSPYLHTGLSNGSMYYYVLTEVNAGIEGPESHEVATAPKAVMPLIPTGVGVAPLEGAVQITLDAASDLTTTRFNLYYATDISLSNPVKLANAFGSATAFTHMPLTNGMLYYYVVTAGELDGESPQSNPVAAQPSADTPAVDYLLNVNHAQIGAPDNVRASAGDQLVNLTWNMPENQIPVIFDPDATPTVAPVISAFNLYWSTKPITNLAQATRMRIPVAHPVELPMTYTHNAGLANSTPYYYIITAVADKDATGKPLKTAIGTVLSFESPASSQVSVTPEAKAPRAPTELSAQAGSQKITLTWQPSTASGATYRVYMSPIAPLKPENLVVPENLVARTTTASYVHTALQNGLTYYYVVTALTEGESTPTSIVVVSLR